MGLLIDEHQRSTDAGRDRGVNGKVAAWVSAVGGVAFLLRARYTESNQPGGPERGCAAVRG